MATNDTQFSEGKTDRSMRLLQMFDRLPNAVVVSQDERGIVLQAEVYTRGAKMWFLSQAEFLEVMEPADFRQEMQETISRMLGNYQEQVQLP